MIVKVTNVKKLLIKDVQHIQLELQLVAQTLSPHKIFPNTELLNVPNFIMPWINSLSETLMLVMFKLDYVLNSIKNLEEVWFNTESLD